ncbi:MAG: hypothetical protein WA829_09915, partial [Candidatus Acidiferrum sp.]
ARLKRPAGGIGAMAGEEGGEGEGSAETSAPGSDQGTVAKRLDRIEHMMQEMNTRLKTIETRIPPPKQ